MLARVQPMGTRAQNEKRFANWLDLPDGGRRYWFEVTGRNGGRARYVKEVGSDEITQKFWQEIYDDSGRLTEVHHKFPIDTGHRPV